MGKGRRLTAPLLTSLLLVALSVVLSSVTGCSIVAAADGHGAPPLVVHFFDVGQGDATLLQHGDVTILIDAGRHDRRDVLPYLQAAGVERLTLVIATHPHADHIGQMDQVIRTFPVEEVWMSGNEHTSRVFERLLDAILDSEAGYHEPRAGEVVALGDLRLEVVSPRDLTGNLNDDSIAVRVVYKDVALLFTGDAERDAERRMVESGLPLKAHILHLGHHGSRTSSTAEFVAAVDPDVAIYSAGAGNTYGHPDPGVIDRLRRAGIAVYGTDVHGTIKVTTDGIRYWVEPERGATGDVLSVTVGTGAAGGSCAPGQININVAPEEELVRIVHIGPARAREIIALRPFASLSDLGRVRGLGSTRLQDIIEEGLACVGP